MPWFALLLMLTAGYVSIKLYSIRKSRGKLKFLGLTIASSIFVIMQLSVVIAGLTANSSFDTASGFIVEWGHVVCLAFILSSLVVFIRESKPVYAQFPLAYTALPLLILISYFLVKDTYALKDLLLAIYQGGAILVALLMYAVYTYRMNDYSLILAGVFGFLISYLSYWYIPGVSSAHSWIWKLGIVIGLVTTVFGYQKVNSESTAKASLQNE